MNNEAVLFRDAEASRAIQVRRDVPASVDAEEPRSGGSPHRVPPPSEAAHAPAARPASAAFASRATRRYAACKWVFDVAAACVLLVLTAPLMLVAMLLVKLTSRGPALYSQTRIGKDGQLFIIHKIRTMYHNCEREEGPRWATPGDPRITRIGRFLRRAHIDELPQLWNVVCGEMSLVGPRPERPEFVVVLDQSVPRYRERLSVRPGMTGLAQVQLPADSDLASVRRKLQYDLHYIREMSATLDLQILIGTFFYLLRVDFGRLPCWLRVPGAADVETESSDSNRSTGWKA